MEALLKQVADLLVALTPIVALLSGTGLLVKYVPWLKNVPNWAIPFLNVLIGFVTAFGATPAHAGFLSGVVPQLGLLGKGVLSFALSGVATIVYETFLRHPLEQGLGWKKAV